MDTYRLKADAKSALEGKWQVFSVCVLICTAASLIFNAPTLIQNIADLVPYLSDETIVDISLETDISNRLLSEIILPSFRLLYQILLSSHLVFSLNAIALRVTKNKDIKVSDILLAFENYGNIFFLSILKGLKVLLWTLFFIIPGIIKELSYSMSDFIMAENPDISPSEALKESEKLMEGHKWDYFVFRLSFLGWNLLSIITLGFSELYSDPYYYTAMANFYNSIKKKEYGDAENFCGSDEMYLQVSYDYITNQPFEEHETQYDYKPQTVEPSYTYFENTYTPIQQQNTSESETSQDTP